MFLVHRQHLGRPRHLQKPAEGDQSYAVTTRKDTQGCPHLPTGGLGRIVTNNAVWFVILYEPVCAALTLSNGNSPYSTLLFPHLLHAEGVIVFWVAQKQNSYSGSVTHFSFTILSSEYILTPWLKPNKQLPVSINNEVYASANPTHSANRVRAWIARAWIKVWALLTRQI